MKAGNGMLAGMAREHEKALLEGWMEEQQKGLSRSRERISDADLRSDSLRFLRVFRRCTAGRRRRHRGRGLEARARRARPASRARGRARGSRRARPRRSSSRSSSRSSRCCARRSTATPEALADETWSATDAARQARALHHRGLPEEPRGGHRAPAAGACSSCRRRWCSSGTASWRCR